MVLSWVRWMRVAFWAACVGVVTLSLLPGQYLPPGAFDWWDKAQHALAFFGLGVLGFSAYPSKGRRVLVGLLIAGVAIEGAQAATGWRYGDWQDCVADAVGVAFSFVGSLIHRISQAPASPSSD